MRPLNPELFEALQKTFGRIRITNHGARASYTQTEDWFSKPLQRVVAENRSPMRVDMWGETYSMCCPKCHDRRFRLYISHVWGVYNEQAGRKFYPAKCHNEGCDWSTLSNDLFGTGNKSFKLDPDALQGSEVHRKMEYPCDPNDLIPVNQLPANHPVCEYLNSRGFNDLDMLAQEYKFCYCDDSPWKREIRDSANNLHIVTPSKRLIIPNIQNGVWSGWQARYIGLIPKDPSSHKPIIQKYLNAPGYSFGATLYRLENAISFTNGELCIVSEGALSAVACGLAGVCTFGMFPKPMQEDLLAHNFCKGQIIFLVESEAKANGRIYQSIERLNSRISGRCVAIDLPEGMDAANMPTEKLFELIHSQIGEKLV
jgi:hypothetical protein